MFVIQSLPRCGTHLVRTALQSHGEIVCYGEVFNPHSREHGFPIERPNVADVLNFCRTRTKQAGFLVQAYVGLESTATGPGLDDVYRSDPQVRAAQGLWSAIPPDARVITLRRRNLLARYVSALIARRRNRWRVRVGEKIPPALRIEVNRQDMFEDFERTKSLEGIARGRFPQALDICYEELCADPDGDFHRMQTYLGIEPRRLIPGTEKLGRPLQETITNYAEVHSWLVGTPYAACLEMP